VILSLQFWVACFAILAPPPPKVTTKYQSSIINNNCQELSHLIQRFALSFSVWVATVPTVPTRKTLQSQDLRTTSALIRLQKPPLLLWGHLSQVWFNGVIVHY